MKVAKPEMKQAFQGMNNIQENMKFNIFRLITESCVFTGFIRYSLTFFVIFESVGIQRNFCVFLYFSLIR